MPKQYEPIADPDELKLEWGELPKESPGIVYICGEYIPQYDFALLHQAFMVKRMSMDYPNARDNTVTKSELSFVEHLMVRGYDITTIKFSIKKKTKLLAV